ncbi:MAG: hypothetical protein IIB38_13780, partial [Candidatus Hydrogenedentes bacterium]|nr:hypothetical protein [Candidatus Hydrogenedentota bacterium]
KPNPNIEYHSWGFGGLRKQANDGTSDYAAEVLRLPLAERPICPYEQVEYNAAVTDALQLVGQSRISAYGRHVAHMLALAQVMMGRAGLALRQGPMTEAMEVRGENYNMTTSKVSAALTAYQILERSWRRLLADFGRHYYATDRWEDVEAYELRIQNDTSPTFSLGERKSRQEETITAPSRGVNSNAGVGGSPAEEDVGAGPRPAHEREAAADSGDSHLRGIDIGGGTGSCAFADEEDLVPAGRAAHREGRPPNGEP